MRIRAFKQLHGIHRNAPEESGSANACAYSDVFAGDCVGDNFASCRTHTR